MEAMPAFRMEWNSFAPSWWLTRIVVAEAMPARSVAAGLLWAAPAVLLLGAVHGWGAAIAAMLALLVALAYMTRLVQRRLQGFTGDTLGALQQAGELAVYLGLAAGG